MAPHFLRSEYDCHEGPIEIISRHTIPLKALKHYVNFSKYTAKYFIVLLIINMPSTRVNPSQK